MLPETRDPHTSRGPAALPLLGLLLSFRPGFRPAPPSVLAQTLTDSTSPAAARRAVRPDSQPGSGAPGVAPLPNLFNLCPVDGLGAI